MQSRIAATLTCIDSFQNELLLFKVLGRKMDETEL